MDASQFFNLEKICECMCGDLTPEGDIFTRVLSGAMGSAQSFRPTVAQVHIHADKI